MHSNALNGSFPTVGLLIEGITGPYQSGIWPGMVESARDLGVHLLCYGGGSLDTSPQNPWEYQRNSLFDIAQRDSLDGYIISGSLGGYISRERFIEFVRRFYGKCLLSLSPILESIPSVYVDNHKGMHDLLTHLIRDHRYTSFAFIRGPEGNFEAEERFMLCKEVLQQHDIALSDENVIQGDFTRECGRNAVEYMFGRKLRVDAIVAAADEIAIGALQGLHDKNVSVPDDVAVVGFDDIPESQVTFPPLTTIRQPMHELGKKAVALIAGLIRGETSPSATVLETTLVLRQSCGCFNYDLSSRLIPPSITTEREGHSARPEEPDIQKSINETEASIRAQASVVIESFIADVNSLRGDGFLKTVNALGAYPDATLEKSDAWGAFFWELWLFARKRYSGSALVFAEALLHACAAVRVELEKRFQKSRTIALTRKNSSLREIGQIIANSLDIDVLVEMACLHFAPMGLSTFFMLLSDQQFHDEPKLIFKCLCIDGKRVSGSALPANPSLAGLIREIDTQQAQVFVVQPLYFQKERFGVIAFKAGDCMPELYEIVSEYICGALHSTLLIQKIQHQTAVLEKANSELTRLQEKEHGLLETINRELRRSRNIQKGFLPQQLPQPQGWEVAASFVPARAVSGDFYDAFMLDERNMVLVIADVSGKDVSAALFMALICTLIRILAERLFAEGVDPLDAVRIINDYVFTHYSQSHDRQMYTTLFIGKLDIATGILDYCNAGHYPPLCIQKGNDFVPLALTGPALGLIPDSTFKKEHLTISPGSMLFAYTDGVTDARNPEGDQFTAKRLFEILHRSAASAREKLEQVETALSDHIRGAAPSDDITILVVRHLSKNVTGCRCGA